MEPLEAETGEAYYPGVDQVDWIGLTLLNYSTFSPDGKDYSFEALYSPYLTRTSFQSGHPVMLAEMGSLSTTEQSAWLKNALQSIYDHHPEIKAVVFFNSGIDKNIPVASASSYIDWKINDLSHLSSHLKVVKRDSLQYYPALPFSSSNPSFGPVLPHMPACKGVNYTKATNWFHNFHVITRKTITKDFVQIKAMGAGTVKWKGPSRYDRSLFLAAEEVGLKVVYEFSLPEGFAFFPDTSESNEMAEIIASTVERYKDNRAVSAWSISSPLISETKKRFFPPLSLYHLYAYTNWLNKVLSKIKTIDSQHPITLSMHADEQLEENLLFVSKQVEGISAYGIENAAGSTNVDFLLSNHLPYYFTSFSAAKLKKEGGGAVPIFLSDWQDTWSDNGVTFDGLLDHWGRKKKSFYEASAAWSAPPAIKSPKISPIDIVASSDASYPNAQLVYHAAVKKAGKWNVSTESKPLPYHFEWYLVRIDEHGKAKDLQSVGTGSMLRLTIPALPHLYQLRLVAATPLESKSVSISLNRWQKGAQSR